MNGWTLVRRSLRYHGRAHLGVLLGATLSAAILVGALAVGDSVRYSLRAIALARLGSIHLAYTSQARFFRADLAALVQQDLHAPTSAAIVMRGTAEGHPANASGEGMRTGRVQVIGTGDEFWQLGATRAPAGGEGVVLNDRLAARLQLKAGDEVTLGVVKPSLLSRDAPLSTIEDSYLTLRLPVRAIVDDTSFGRFGLEANQVAPFNAFVPLATLQRLLGQPGRANTLLVGEKEGRAPTPEQATAALWKHWQFPDAGLELREVSLKGVRTEHLLELRTERVFLDPSVADAVRQAAPDTQSILTYFVNELRVGDRATPYSTVAALPPMGLSKAMTGLADDEAFVNQWFAEDVGAKVGDTVRLAYWVMGPMRRLQEQTATFRIKAILPLSGAAADPDLMPTIPGLSDKKNCRDWEPGVPIDLDKIRDKDQAYWDAHRGTPKAFITLKAGQRIWNNRFGTLTAVRFPLPTPDARARVEDRLRQALSPASLGIFFTPVRQQALAASNATFDFGQLFLGFSFFLIIAALLLTALLFAFGVEQRAEEVGTLLALGFAPKRVRRLLLAEGAAIALTAGILGSGCGIFYTQAIVRGLSTVWKGAVANSALRYHAEPTTLFTGAIVGFLVSLFAIWLVARRQAQVPARELLNAGAESETRLLAGNARPRKGGLAPGLAMALVCGLGGILSGAAALMGRADKAAGFFFGAGALLLIAGIAFCRFLMGRMERQAEARPLTLISLGARNTARRVGRSLSAVALLACGSFLVIAVGANRHDPMQDAGKRQSGTGGFLLYAQSTLPIYNDLNTAEGRDIFGLDEAALQGVEIVPLRLREGDDASCLNLNRAQVPNLLGVPVEALRKRGAFVFSSLADASAAQDPWSLLDRTLPEDAVPVVGDRNTIVWSLGKKVGDTIPYADERGNVTKLQIVGILGNSILQGSLLLSERQFVRHFPSASGYQVFLVDRADGKTGDTTALVRTLSNGLKEVGFDATPAPERMAEFNTVENTYLSIFAVLGGLGLLLGSLGLGVVVLRNVLERRSELALLRSVGFQRVGLHWLIFSEHVLLLALGLMVGIVAALIAVLPALTTPGAGVPYLSLSLTLLAVFLSGFVWTWGATTLALRGPLLNALRSE
jgi:putative ABC transport system permease protein